MNILHYLRHRFIKRMHLIDTKLTKGQWWDFDARLLHGCMEGLVEFVEVECAHMANVFEKKENKTHGTPREIGLHHLDWEIGLGDDNKSQSETAKEVKEIYLWWKDERPKRIDPWGVDGELEALDTKYGLALSGQPPAVCELYSAEYKKIGIQEEECGEEDDHMLIRLMKIRRNLWT